MADRIASPPITARALSTLTKAAGRRTLAGFLLGLGRRITLFGAVTAECIRSGLDLIDVVLGISLWDWNYAVRLLQISLHHANRVLLHEPRAYGLGVVHLLALLMSFYWTHPNLLDKTPLEWVARYIEHCESASSTPVSRVKSFTLYRAFVLISRERSSGRGMHYECFVRIDLAAAAERLPISPFVAVQ